MPGCRFRTSWCACGRGLWQTALLLDAFGAESQSLSLPYPPVYRRRTKPSGFGLLFYPFMSRSERPSPVATPKGANSELRGSPPKGKSKVINSPPASSGPSQQASPPQMNSDAPPMDRDSLLRTLHSFEGRQIPSSKLTELAQAIQAQAPDGPRVPSTVNQKRTFVEDWFKSTTSAPDYTPPPPPRRPGSAPP